MVTSRNVELPPYLVPKRVDRDESRAVGWGRGGRPWHFHGGELNDVLNALGLDPAGWAAVCGTKSGCARDDERMTRDKGAGRARPGCGGALCHLACQAVMARVFADSVW
jgi:hypothetical protein